MNWNRLSCWNNVQTLLYSLFSKKRKNLRILVKSIKILLLLLDISQDISSVAVSIPLASSQCHFDKSEGEKGKIDDEKSIQLTFNWNSNKLFLYISTFLCFNQHHRDVARLSFSILLISTCTHRKKNGKKQKTQQKREDFSYLDNRIIIL